MVTRPNWTNQFNRRTPPDRWDATPESFFPSRLYASSGPTQGAADSSSWVILSACDSEPSRSNSTLAAFNSIVATASAPSAMDAGPRSASARADPKGTPRCVYALVA